MTSTNKTMNVIALRGLVVFPDMRIQFELGREKSINSLLNAAINKEDIFLVTQKSSLTEDPDFSDLYNIGVICKIEEFVKNPNNSIARIAVKGLEKAKIINGFESPDNFLQAEIQIIEEKPAPKERLFIDGLLDLIKDMFNTYAQTTRKISQGTMLEIFDCKNVSKITDLIASHSIDDYEKRQMLLEITDPVKRAKTLCTVLNELTESNQLRNAIEDEVQSRMDDNQREYFLREELKVISEELGTDETSEINDFTEKINLLPIEQKFKDKLLKECNRLSKMQTISPEATVTRTYLEEILALPFGKYDKENHDIEKAVKILDKDHYGLQKIKDRFVEMLCSYSLGASPSGQILCLIGPPGIGKTSIAKSVAKAMGRSYARISLGGVSDEAEIRGHRKTYIGAMPGRIMAAIKQAGSMNCLILLDEIDKLGKDYKGDPCSALLEVLDPEQNKAFVDHFIDIPFDLSKIVFLTTANDASTIPLPLYDRMEKIELDSYTFEEKLHIASKHLVKKQALNYGLKPSQITITKGAMGEIINGYTKEAGVRMLESKIGAVIRKVVTEVAQGKEKVSIKAGEVRKYLGNPKYKNTLSFESRRGVVNGLAWTSAGGEMLQVEAVAFDGTGKSEITGSLGDVMKESVKVSQSVVRSLADEYGLDKDYCKTKDIHIHVPEGAVPKDGPSAGVTITTAVFSALSGKKVKGDIAMTGEITLTGRVTAIGGLKEKSMAAYKNSIATVIIPEDNLPDIDEISEEVKSKIQFVPVNNIRQVLNIAIE